MKKIQRRINIQGIIKLNQIPETCKDCPFHTYSSGCMLKRRTYEGFKAARPDWCPIEIIKTNEGSENDV